jgi:preprotein translocase subunit SecE
MIDRIKKFFNDVKIEMAKVSWPTQNELINSTGIVVFVSVVFAILVFTADLIISRIIEFFY